MLITKIQGPFIGHPKNTDALGSYLIVKPTLPFHKDVFMKALNLAHICCLLCVCLILIILILKSISYNYLIKTN